MGTLTLLFAGASAQAQPLPQFMAGCWKVIDGDHWTQECWMEPRAGLMLGASREGTGTKLKSWEQMRVELSTDGKVTLFASPHGREAVPFEGRVLSANAVEFTNAKHDYPQRLRYEFKDGRLNAEISLIDGSHAERWSYARENR